MYSPSVFPLSLKNPWLPTPLLAFPADLMVIPCHLHLVIEGETAIGSFVALKTVNGISRRIAVSVMATRVFCWGLWFASETYHQKKKR